MPSFIKAPAKHVHELCVDYLDRQQAHVLQMQEPLIQKAMKPKWFGLVKGKTREEATAHLENWDSLFGKYHLAKLSGCIQASRADDLRKLCLLNIEGDVLVDDFVAGFLRVEGNRGEYLDTIKKEMYMNI
jgi:hypothetical protein